MDSGETAFSNMLINWRSNAAARRATDTYDFGNDDANIGGKTADDFTDSFAYDLNGNRITKTHDQGNDGTVDLTINNTTDARNRRFRIRKKRQFV